MNNNLGLYDGYLEDYQKILNFWFATTPDYDKWFYRGYTFDPYIKQHFEKLLIKAEAGLLDNWMQNPNSYLSLIILLDQFPRHIYRGTAKAIYYDRLAFKYMINGLHHIKYLPPYYQMFALRPFIHTESPKTHIDGIRILHNLKNKSSNKDKIIFDNMIGHHLGHYKIIKKFGRYPHWNNPLGRKSTKVETIYLNNYPYHHMYKYSQYIN